VAVTVQMPPGAAEPGSHPVHFDIVSLNDPGIHVTEKSVFIVPR
jgi:hypothetical protein